MHWSLMVARGVLLIVCWKPFGICALRQPTPCPMKGQEPGPCCLTDVLLPVCSKSTRLYFCHFRKRWVFSAKNRTRDRCSFLTGRLRLFLGRAGDPEGAARAPSYRPPGSATWVSQEASGASRLTRCVMCGGNTAVHLLPRRRRDTGGGGKRKSLSR